MIINYDKHHLLGNFLASKLLNAATDDRVEWFASLVKSLKIIGKTFLPLAIVSGD